MAEPIAINDIRLTRIEPDQMTSTMAQSGVSWFNLTLTVKNLSYDRPIYVMENIRRMHYDDARRVLVLHLSEQNAPASHAMGRQMPPRYRTIQQGEVAAFTHRISSPITFLRETADGGREPSYVRLAEDVDAIECTLAYETEPPAAAVNLTARGFEEYRQGKGATVQGFWKPSREDRKDTYA